MKGKRILIVSEVFWPEDFVVNDLAREWQKMGFEVEVLTQYPSYPQGRVYPGYKNAGETVQDWDGIKIHRFPLIEGYAASKIRKFANYLKFVHQGKRIARRIGAGFDLIFVSQTGPLTVALPAVAAGKKHNVPVAVWTQDIWPNVVWAYGVPKLRVIEWCLDALIRRIYRGCDSIFVSSRRFEDIVCRYTDKAVTYAPNWLRPVDEVKSDLVLAKDKFHFTFTGNISRYQNLSNTVTGFAKAALQDCVLNIVGDGSYIAEVKRVVSENNIRNVVFHGRKPYNTINDILCQSDVLLLPLINDEGIMLTEPFKIQSYLHAGKPIMGVLGGSGKEIIEENALGLVAAPDDTDDIARVFRAMRQYASENSAAVKQRAAHLLESRFNKDSIIRTITKLSGAE